MYNVVEYSIASSKTYTGYAMITIDTQRNKCVLETGCSEALLYGMAAVLTVANSTVLAV